MRKDIHAMAVVFYETPSNDYDKPWVEDYFDNLDAPKQKNFFKQVFLAEKAILTQKGYILETREFKSWLWKSESVVLDQAVQACRENGHAVCLGFRKGANGKFKTLVGSDSSIVQMVKEEGGKSLSFTQDF